MVAVGIGVTAKKGLGAGARVPEIVEGGAFSGRVTLAPSPAALSGLHEKIIKKEFHEIAQDKATHGPQCRNTSEPVGIRKRQP